MLADSSLGKNSILASEYDSLRTGLPQHELTEGQRGNSSGMLRIETIRE